MQNVNEKNVSIGNGLHIFTSDCHPFGTDAILLADFACPKKSDIACDLGSGSGIIPFLWARGDAPRHITAVELQKNAVELMKKSIAHNQLAERIIAMHGDLREPERLGIEAGSLSLITINPPYFGEGNGFESKEISQRLARHALTCSTEDIMRCAQRLLKFGGRLCLCHKPEHLADILCSMRAHGIEPKRLRFVCSKPKKAPYLVLIEGRKGSGKQLNVFPELCVQNADGSWSEEMKTIYGEYGDGTKQ